MSHTISRLVAMTCCIMSVCLLNSHKSMAAVNPQEPQTVEPLPSKLVGKTGIYKAPRVESLRQAAGKLGCNSVQLAASNGLKPNAMLKAGQAIHYNNLRIIPNANGRQAVINIPDRTIYLYDQAGKFLQYSPVAVGQPKSPTPTGSFSVLSKQKNPTWRVPASIQEEMRRAGKKVVKEVPPGPKNPLGTHAIRTSLPNILIHSTDKPASIFGFNSHGCIRVDPNKIDRIFSQVQPHMKGEITYQPVKLAAKDDGRIFIEVHRDVYSKKIDLAAAVRNVVAKHGLTERVDWLKVNQVIAKRDGFAVEVSINET